MDVAIRVLAAFFGFGIGVMLFESPENHTIDRWVNVGSIGCMVCGYLVGKLIVWSRHRGES